MSVSGRSEMTTAAAWIEALRTIPSRPRATSTICLAVGSLATSAASSAPGCRQSSKRRRAAHARVGDQLGEAVADAVVVAEDARGVARGGAREHAAEGDDLGDAVVAVLLGHVADHAVAAADGEVDVDVRHRHALGVEEALEQQVVAERVDVGDLEAVGDDAARRGAAPGADRDPVRLGVGDEVPHDQEVGVEAHVADDGELHVGALAGLRRDRVAVALAQALVDERAEVGLLGLAVGRVEARDQLLLERDRGVAALGDLERGGERLRHVGERLRHLLRALQVELVRVEGHLRLGERRLRLHAQQRGVVVVVLLAEVVHVGGGDERAAHLLRELRDRLVDLLLLGDAVALDLEVDVLRAEDLDEVVEVGAGLREAALDDAPRAAGGQAAGERDDALGVALEQVEVDARLAAVQALEEAGARELGEVLEALVRLREQRQVVALDLALADRAVVDEVRLEAEDRLDAVLLAGLVELDRAVHDPVVGEAERGLAEGGRAGGEAVDRRGAVEQRVLGVDVQVRGGRGAHGRLTLGTVSDGETGLAARCGKRRSGALGAVDPRLQLGDRLAVAADDGAVPGRGRLAAQEVGERLGGERDGGVGAARAAGSCRRGCPGRCRP